MAPTNHTGEPGAAVGPRQTEPARRHAHWRTAITHVELNRILIRGYPVDEMMGRLSFGEAVYLLLVGELPSPAIGKLMEALLVSSLDHSVTPPSTLPARCGDHRRTAPGERRGRDRGFDWRACNAVGTPTQRPDHGERAILALDWFFARGLELPGEPRVIPALAPATGAPLSDHDAIAVTVRPA